MNLPKLLFVTTTTLTVIGGAFLAGVYSTVQENALYRLVRRATFQIQDSIQAVDETSLVVPKHFLQPARKPGDGVTVNERGDGGFIMIAGFFKDTNEIRLIRRDGSIVRRWPVRFGELFPNASSYMVDPKHPATDWNIDLHGALVMPDGSVVFNFDYGGLAKLDRCGNVQWTLDHATHHSVERAERGGFWIPGRRRTLESKFPPYKPPFLEDLILHVSDDGKILSEISVPALFYSSPGVKSVFTTKAENSGDSTGPDHELVHVNKIEELPSAIADRYPGFEAGDLLLSLRDLNLVFVVDPDTWIVKWWQVGPWIRQHDSDFSPDGRIIVFNNNAFAMQLLEGNRSDLSLPRVTNIMATDPGTHETRVIYGGRTDQEMFSVIRGKQQITPSGGLLITEFEAGRAFETDAEGRIVWEFINRYDDSDVAELTEATLYAADYFSVTDWSCEGAGRTNVAN